MLHCTRRETRAGFYIAKHLCLAPGLVGLGPKTIGINISEGCRAKGVITLG